MKRLMILGSVKYFENLVFSAKESGIYTIVCDNRQDTPAKKVCDEAIDIDVMDLDALKNIAIEKKVDGVITSFTDSLLIPYTFLTSELNLPSVIKREQLESVTNKLAMKDIFRENNIKSTEYWVVNSIEEVKMKEVKFPVVMKPLDSSGSKGIFFVNNMDELIIHFHESQSFSSDNRVLIEEFYESEEIQGLCWVYDGEAHVMYLGDRELVSIHEGRPGKPVRLIYPSKYCYQYEEEIKRLYQRIATAFKIKNGPIYVQMLMGRDGIKVSEMMTRLPGGCDYIAVKQATGFDAGKLFVNFAVGNKINFDDVKKNSMKLDKCPYALPIYIKPGKIGKINNVKEIEDLPYVSQFLLNVKEGDIIQGSGDLRQDCGRVYGISNNIFDANKKREEIHSMIEILDENGENMIQNF